MSETTDFYQLTIGLLARREHSRHELLYKLIKRGASEDAAIRVIDQVAAQGYQCDERFAEAYTNEQIARGYGPVRIRSALQTRGISAAVIDAVLESDDDFWAEKASAVWQKRFGLTAPENPAALAKQQNFMRYRGYSYEQIRRAMSATHEDIT